jgi:hypothetical protein
MPPPGWRETVTPFDTITYTSSELVAAYKMVLDLLERSIRATSITVIGVKEQSTAVGYINDCRHELTRRNQLYSDIFTGIIAWLQTTHWTLSNDNKIMILCCLFAKVSGDWGISNGLMTTAAMIFINDIGPSVKDLITDQAVSIASIIGRVEAQFQAPDQVHNPAVELIKARYLEDIRGYLTQCLEESNSKSRTTLVTSKDSEITVYAAQCRGLFLQTSESHSLCRSSKDITKLFALYQYFKSNVKNAENITILGGDLQRVLEELILLENIMHEFYLGEGENIILVAMTNMSLIFFQGVLRKEEFLRHATIPKIFTMSVQDMVTRGLIVNSITFNTSLFNVLSGLSRLLYLSEDKIHFKDVVINSSFSAVFNSDLILWWIKKSHDTGPKPTSESRVFLLKLIGETVVDQGCERYLRELYDNTYSVYKSAHQHLSIVQLDENTIENARQYAAPVTLSLCLHSVELGETLNNEEQLLVRTSHDEVHCHAYGITKKKILFSPARIEQHSTIHVVPVEVEHLDTLLIFKLDPLKDYKARFRVSDFKDAVMNDFNDYHHVLLTLFNPELNRIVKIPKWNGKGSTDRFLIYLQYLLDTYNLPLCIKEALIYMMTKLKERGAKVNQSTNLGMTGMINSIIANLHDEDAIGLSIAFLHDLQTHGKHLFGEIKAD